MQKPLDQFTKFVGQVAHRTWKNPLNFWWYTESRCIRVRVMVRL